MLLFWFISPLRLYLKSEVYTQKAAGAKSSYKDRVSGGIVFKLKAMLRWRYRGPAWPRVRRKTYSMRKKQISVYEEVVTKSRNVSVVAKASLRCVSVSDSAWWRGSRLQPITASGAEKKPQAYVREHYRISLWISAKHIASFMMCDFQRSERDWQKIRLRSFGENVPEVKLKAEGHLGDLSQ